MSNLNGESEGSAFDATSSQDITGLWRFNTSTNNDFFVGDSADPDATPETYGLRIFEAPGVSKNVTLRTEETASTNDSTCLVTLFSDTSAGGSTATFGAGSSSQIVFTDDGEGAQVCTATADSFGFSADTDATFQAGRACLCSPTTDVMQLSHVDRQSNAEYALEQTQNGTTSLNSRGSKTLYFKIGNTTRGRFDGNQLAIGSNAAAADTDTCLDLKDTNMAFKPNRLTTTQRDALTASDGMVIFNTTTSKHQGYDGTIWNDFY